MLLEEFVDEDGKSPFGKWFAELDAIAAAKIAVALGRMEQGNLSNAKPVGEGVSEFRIDFGPGYRVYFALDGPKLVILLMGGTKRRQSLDIRRAKDNWSSYKFRMREKI